MKNTMEREWIGDLQKEFQEIAETYESEKSVGGIFTFSQDCMGVYTIICC